MRMQIGNELRAAEPLVTVIIPSYNHERYISHSIESVVSQTYKNLDLIVIDDGSQDESVKIINNLADKYNFKVIARENRGLSKTLNEGISLAIGRYICFLASDDYFLPHRVKNAVLQLEKSDNRVAMVYCDGYIINDDDQRIGLFGEKFPRPVIGGVYNNLLIANWIPALGVTYKSEVLKQFMFDERFKIEDHTLFLRMFKSNKYKLVFYNGFDFAYRRHENNISKPSDLMCIENKLIQDHFDDVGSFAKFKQQLKNRVYITSEMARWKNFYLLYLQLIRTLQYKFINYLKKQN